MFQLLRKLQRMHVRSAGSEKGARWEMMGDSSASMLYFFLIFLVVYVAGAGIYTLVKFVKKKLEKKKQEDLYG